MQFTVTRVIETLYVGSRKYPHPSRDGLLVCTPHPFRNSSLASYVPLQILAFETPPPTPSELPATIHGVGMDNFWDSRIHKHLYYLMFLIINITISLNMIGLKYPLFSTNLPPNLLLDSLLSDNSINQSQLKLQFK